VRPPLVLALNPSIDAEWRVDFIRAGEKNIVLSERRWAGGKGVNVARWLRWLGGPAELLLPLGQAAGVEMAGHLRSERLRATPVPIQEATRVNIVVTADNGDQLRFNPRGPKLSAREWRKLASRVRAILPCVSAMALSGSLPRSAPAATYARWVRLARLAGVKSFLDCDGPALAMGARARPFLVKPNRHELEQWFGRKLSKESAVTSAARALSTLTRGWVLVSLGGSGAQLVNTTEDIALEAAAPKCAPRNTVGAGDALLAAVIREAIAGTPPTEWLRQGIAAGTAATQCLAGRLPNRSLLESLASRIRVRGINS
jgi:1-phosphofructokinase family hexose kinase